MTQAATGSENILSFLNGKELEKGVLVSYSGMPEFQQTQMPITQTSVVNFGTCKKPARRTVTTFVYRGILKSSLEENEVYVCPECGCTLHGNGPLTTELKHIPSGSCYQKLLVKRQRFDCSNEGCSYSMSEPIPFKAEGHMITHMLETFIVDLLKHGETMKRISMLTGVSKNVIKDIDMKRLQGKYTIGGKGEKLIKPEQQAEYLAVDEFKLHDGYVYATIIIDLSNGHVLWIAHGKKKQCVYDFIDHAGMDWMKGVKAVACDMNSDFEEAFREKCEWIAIVFDRFHIVKYFNEKVISEVRKDEQRRLMESGEEEAAKSLKGSRYILMTSEETRNGKERDAEEGKILDKGGTLFYKPQKVQGPGIKEEYERLLKENKLFVTIDIIKEQLKKAYEAKTERGMKIHINRIVRMCKATGNKHFEKFARLLENHMEGIIAHAKYQISSGKVEGTNNMIKTLRRQGYGYPDDDYFFLKIMDASRRDIHWA